MAFVATTKGYYHVHVHEFL